MLLPDDYSPSDHNLAMREVISRAENLSYLHLGDYFSFFEWWKGCDVMYDLPIPSRLARLELCVFSLGLYGNPKLPLELSNVKVLCMSCWESYFPPESFSRLVRWISRGNCGALITLILDDLPFGDEDEVEHEVIGSCISEKADFLSIRELSVSRCSLRITPFQLAHYTPNLQTLHLSPSERKGSCFIGLGRPAPVNASFTSALSLRLLSVFDSFRACPARLPWHTDVLFSINTHKDSAHLSPALNVCDPTALVGLRFRFAQEATDVWKAVAQHAPQLQWLELESLHDASQFSVFAQLVSSPAHTVP